MANSQQQIVQLQAQLNDLQTVMQQQNNMIANLSAAARAQTLANSNQPKRTISTNHLADKVMEQFVKSPIKFFNKVNPCHPKLSFDGSNYSEWENAVDWTLQHAFVRDTSFLNDKQDNFQKLDSLQNKSVAMLMRVSLGLYGGNRTQGYGGQLNEFQVNE
ncbi:hypothetical protein PCANC_09514 [Puccinia coronata f. sp. avenae]|uniref:Uncharacterized protein n=1 Tax=Puccinia coronata f. sp. avenae TaxID=200324 RepID=A0A2N5V4W9_9BASI|nr:hypothetical protein PCASD_17657 [Puccinia coronata f. sp. avenae]PLW45048.1 hypothetical protein PCANC_09514 [Puccinia coronata f. sp. avenae]